MYQVYKDLVSGPKFRMVDLSKRVYIVTGSNTGIGKILSHFFFIIPMPHTFHRFRNG